MSEQRSKADNISWQGFSTKAVHAGYEPDPLTGAVNVPAPSLVPAPDGSVQPLPQPVAFTVDNVQLADSPVILPAVVGSSDAITTSVSPAQVTSTVPQPMPTNGQVTQAVVQAQTAPLPATAPPANPQGSLTWLWLGGGALALLATVGLFRKK